MNDSRKTRAFIDQLWDESIVPALCEYIRVPNVSPAFDADWEAHGHMEKAAQMLLAWVQAQPVRGMRAEIVRLPGRTPVILAEIDGAVDDTVLLYGHLDKQPAFSGWRQGLGPWQPVLRDGRLYGRGGADDGYALFGSIAAIRALQEQGIAHGRCVLLIEGCEESGSFDLPFYVEALRERIGEPSLVVCLDAECGNYDQLWITTSLRGVISGSLNVEILREGVHSGAASGIVPSSFRIARLLLDRIEDPATGASLVDALTVDIPAFHRSQAGQVAAVLGDEVAGRFPFVDGAGPVAGGGAELVLNNTWRPTLSVTGAAGLPDLAQAGNTLRPNTTLKLSFRLPPSVEPRAAAAALKQVLEREPPYGARVSFTVDAAEGGWQAPPLDDWLQQVLRESSQHYFGAPAMYMGTGGTIPFMRMLGELFPRTGFVVTGVLGPASNAHGPNEFLHIATGKKVSACVADVLAVHGARGA